jgi:hypothetical protein
LRRILEVASLSLRLGVDGGEDKPSGWMQEQFARGLGLLKDHERIAPNIHGILVLPDDDHTRIPIMNAHLAVTGNLDDLLNTLTELGENNDSVPDKALTGIKLLNRALMTNEPLAKMVLAFSAIEELGQDQEWSEAQSTLIERLTARAESSSLPDEERAEVTKQFGPACLS